MAEAFGGILTLSLEYGTIVFISLLMFLVFLEWIVEKIEHEFEKKGYKEVFEKLQKELMVLGIISFSVTIYDSISASASGSEVFAAFEISHVVILFIAFSFIIQTIVLITYAVREGRNVLQAVSTTSDELIEQYEEIENSTDTFYGKLRNYAFFKFSHFIPFFPTFRSHIEYKIIERFFIRNHNLPREFKFSKYATYLFKTYVSEVSETSAFGWFTLALLVLVNLLRVEVFDADNKVKYCGARESIFSNGTDEHHDEERRLTDTLYQAGLIGLSRSFFSRDQSYLETTYLTRYLQHEEEETIAESVEKSCLEYIFVYAFINVVFLTVFIFITYLMSCLYFERLIEICMNQDDVSSKTIGRQSYNLMLKKMSTSEKWNDAKTNQNILEINGATYLNEDFSHGEINIENDNVDDTAADEKSSVQPVSNGLSLVRPDQNPESPSNDAWSPRTPGSGSDTPSNAHKLRRNSGRASLSLDGYNQEREKAHLKKEHAKELMAKLPFYERLQARVFHLGHEIYQSVTGSYSDDEDEVDVENIHSTNDTFSTNNPSKVTRKKKSRIGIREISRRTFLFGHAHLYGQMVELGLLFQSFYIAIWATELMPLTRYSDHMGLWVVAFSLPILVNIPLFGMTLHRSVMLKAVSELHPEVVGTVCEECIQEKNAIRDLQNRVRDKLTISKTPKSQWKAYVRDQFFQFDTDGSGTLDQFEFRDFLGTLDIFMTRSQFNILWEAVDVDQSGSVTWDELFVVIFPEYKNDIKEEVKLIENVQSVFNAKFHDEKIPKSKQLNYVHELFRKFDANSDDVITKIEFWNMLKSLDIEDLTRKNFQLLCGSVDGEGTGEIKFEEVKKLVFGNDLQAVTEHSNERKSLLVNPANESSGGVFRFLPFMAHKDSHDTTNGSSRAITSLRFESTNGLNESPNQTSRKSGSHSLAEPEMVHEPAINHIELVETKDIQSSDR